MQMKKYRVSLIAFLLAGLLLAGCGQSAPQAPQSAASQIAGPSSGRAYLVPLHNTQNFIAVPRYAVVDAAGNELFRGGDMQYLYDIYTYRPYGITAQRGEKTGEVDANGQEVLQVYSQLYDLQGNLLADWAPCVYQGVFDGWVIAASEAYHRADISGVGAAPDGFWCELRDMNTGDVKLQDVYTLLVQADDSLVAADGLGYVAGVLDKDLNTLAGFPMDAQYASLQVISGGYIAMTMDETDGLGNAFLLDEAMQPLTDGDTYSFISSAGDGYVIAQLAGDGDTAQRVLRTQDASVVYETEPGEWVDYYDENAMLLVVPAEDGIAYSLRDAKGNPLAEDAAQAGAMPRSGNYEADAFYTVDDNTLTVLETGGSIRASVECGQVSSIIYDADRERFTLSYYSDEGMQDAWVLDGSLNTIVEQGSYVTIVPLYGTDQLLSGTKVKNGDYTYALYDMLDLSGKVLVEDLRGITYTDGERLVAQKGFSVGLMDMQGNWLWETSSFGALED